MLIPVSSFNTQKFRHARKAHATDQRMQSTARTFAATHNVECCEPKAAQIFEPKVPLSPNFRPTMRKILNSIFCDAILLERKCDEQHRSKKTRTLICLSYDRMYCWLPGSPPKSAKKPEKHVKRCMNEARHQKSQLFNDEPKFACEIQVCLQKNQLSEDKCQLVIQQFNRCVWFRSIHIWIVFMQHVCPRCVHQERERLEAALKQTR